MARSICSDPNHLTAEKLRRWFAGQTQWRIETRRGYRNSAVSFFGWAHKAGHLTTNPATDLPPVKPDRPVPRPAPDRVWRQALQAAGPRVALMMRLAAEAGLRRAEVAQVHTRDLREGFDGPQLLVHGKGNRERVIPITDDLADLIALGAPGHTPEMAAYGVEGWLFPGDEDGHLSPRWVGKLVAAAMPAGYTMHTLRHRFATRAYRGTRNLRAVQTLLGHANVAVTERYTAVDDSEVRAAMQAAKTDEGISRLGMMGAAMAIVLALTGFSPPVARAITDWFTPDEQLVLAVLEADPEFEYRDRTPRELIYYARHACQIDQTEGDEAALAYLVGNPRLLRPSRYWGTISETMCPSGSSEGRYQT
ncbi:integrase [Mycobacterium phage Typha]|uniref:Integrase n=1 Tax=Mycobacterium phage Typha TaxID=2517971 RepID=A0A482J6R9_9CAUD|nr:integrase [Mycobacterium phage Typha]QBP29707.1 integrase [Mycobacterium phage Typha]